MLGAIGAGSGGLLGAGLGQVGDALSAPRRMLWNALGGPDSGAELVNKLTGMDPNSFLTQALGMGAEVAGDPLTWAGALAGAPLARLGAQPWLQEAKLLGAAGDLRAGIGGADAALAARSGLEAQTLAQQLEAAQGLAKYDVPGIAAGETKQFAQMANPDVAAALSQRGLGGVLPAMEGRTPAVAFGRETPFGFDTPTLRGEAGGKMIGRGLALDPAVSAEMLPRAMTPGDRDFLGNFAGQTLGGPLQMSPLETQAALDALGQHSGKAINAARPMPTLAQAAQENPLLEQLLGPRAQNLPMQAPLTDARAQMAQTLANTDSQLQRYRMTRPDWGMVGGAGLTGLGLGGYLGGR